MSTYKQKEGGHLCFPKGSYGATAIVRCYEGMDGHLFVETRISPINAPAQTALNPVPYCPFCGLDNTGSPGENEARLEAAQYSQWRYEIAKQLASATINEDGSKHGGCWTGNIDVEEWASGVVSCADALIMELQKEKPEKET